MAQASARRPVSVPTIGITEHDRVASAAAAPWLQGLNSGDARGTLYGKPPVV
jgi:hypothetical protein